MIMRGLHCEVLVVVSVQTATKTLKRSQSDRALPNQRMSLTRTPESSLRIFFPNSYILGFSKLLSKLFCFQIFEILLLSNFSKLFPTKP